MLALLLCLQLAPAQHRVRIPPPPPPNVLVIVADDVGVDQLGCYASSYPTLAIQPCTPNIDQLAASGMRFTNAWSNPVCSPTRAQLLSGKRASHTGVGTISYRGPPTIGNHGLQSFEDTLASLLGGHESVAVGKWHVSDPFQDGTNFDHPLLCGFDFYAGSLYGLDPDYDDWTKCISPPGLLLPGFSEHATTDTTDDALNLLATLQEPWLLYVCYNAAHWPFHCPEDQGFPTGDCQVGACGQQWCQDCNSLLSDPMCVTHGAMACQSRAMVHSMDSKIGEILSAIDPAKTVVIFISDNGTPIEPSVPPFSKAHAKGTLFQGGINVPLIVRVPGGTPGVSHELVSATDLFATVADLEGVVPPSDPQRDSVSLGPLLLPQSFTGAPRQHVFSEYFLPNFEPIAGSPPPGFLAQFHHRAIRNDAYKLIDNHGWDQPSASCVSERHFYKLADAPRQDPAFGPDPFEQNDLMLSIGSWTPEDQAAFAELDFQLMVNYPRLPTICP